MTLRFGNPIGLATNPFLILLIGSKARPLSIKQCTLLTGSSSSRKTSLIQCKICIQKLLSFCKLGKFKISYFLSSSSYRLILMISFNDICNLNIFWWCLLLASENLFIYAPQLFWPFFLLIRTFPYFFFRFYSFYSLHFSPTLLLASSLHHHLSMCLAWTVKR